MYKCLLGCLLVFCLNENTVNPMGTLRKNDVVLTSMRREDVASMSIRRHFGTICPLGTFNISNTDILKNPLKSKNIQKIYFEISVIWNKLRLRDIETVFIRFMYFVWLIDVQFLCFGLCVLFYRRRTVPLCYLRFSLLFL